jgi:hypothetical protein
MRKSVHHVGYSHVYDKKLCLTSSPFKVLKFLAKSLHRIYQKEANYDRLPELCHQRRTNIASVLYITGRLVNQIPRQNSPINYTSIIELQLE